MANKIYHIISHTHWDREWYLPFEQFRIKLVALIDELRDIFRKEPDYKHFLLDGQTIILEDYLELRPEAETELRSLIKEGKLSIGPWYVLADEFLVSGEALIRNLQIGAKVAQRFGKSMSVGYVPDSFGHIAQLPQILAGFDIDNAVLYRGFGGEPGQSVSEYNWFSPDGSKCLMIHLPQGGYTFGESLPLEKELLKKRLDEMDKFLIARAQTPHLLIMNGADHILPQRKLPDIIKIMAELRPNDKFIHDSPENYINSVKPSNKQFPPVHGELRFGYRHSYVLQGVHSTRMYLKQMNTHCQRLLERWAEPFSAIAIANGFPDTRAFIEQSWKYLLQNHPHDSICGCSIDSVHKEMITRFNKSSQIAESVISNNLKLLAFGDSEKPAPDNKEYLFLFNPSHFPRSEAIECHIDLVIKRIPIGQGSSVKDKAVKESNRSFKLIDSREEEVPFQILSAEEVYSRADNKYYGPSQKIVKRFHLVIDAKDIPPLGFKAFRIEECSKASKFKSDIQCARNRIENEFLAIDIKKDGSVFATDKASGVKYGPLNVFEDSADVGDEYNYSYPLHDKYYYSTQFKPIIRSISSKGGSAFGGEAGPLRAVIEITHKIILPESATKDETGRAKDKKTLIITTRITLAKGDRRIDFQTRIDNNIKDHRLRTCFELGEATAESFTDSAFHIVKREHQDYNPADFKLEYPSKTHPMQEFVSIRGLKKKRAFTLIADGLPEYELKLDKKGTLALTLLRCVGKLSGSKLLTRKGGDAGWKNDTPDAQCQGVFEARYSIFPHSPNEIGTWAKIFTETEKHNLKMICVQGTTNQKTQENWFASIEPSCIRFSALKPAQDGTGFIMRYWNPTDREISAKINFASIPKSVNYVTLAEKDGQAIPINKDGSIHTAVGSHKIQSIRVIN
jgi:mannosylglycerate hydrolase